jgi:hypothetical protein
MSLAGGLRELLRPPPHRGPLIASGAVVLGVGLALEEVRLADTVPDAVHTVLLLLVGSLVLWLGAQAPNEDGVPPAYQSVLLVTGLFVVFGGLLSFASAVDGGGLSPGGFCVASAVTAALALWPAFERNSAISLLLAALLGGVVLVAAWQWVFDPDGATAYRWLLALYAAALVLLALALRAPARRHAEVLVDAAGLAVAGIAFTAWMDGSELSAFWETVLLGAGFGLVAFGALDRSPGPAYVGVLNLAGFVAVVTAGGEETLLWWPLVLLAAGALMLLAGLRPRRPLPPEPEPYRAGEAPLAARADPERERHG